jgi:hypothetical protein
MSIPRGRLRFRKEIFNIEILFFKDRETAKISNREKAQIAHPRNFRSVKITVFTVFKSNARNYFTIYRGKVTSVRFLDSDVTLPR